MGLFDDYFSKGVPVYDSTSQGGMTQRPVGYIINNTASPIPRPNIPATPKPMSNLRISGLPVSSPLQAMAEYNEKMQQQRSPSSMLAKIRSGLGASPTSPVGMAISSGAQSLLEQSGYSPVPRTTGEIFGKALGAAREGYLGGVALERDLAKQQKQFELSERELEILYKRASKDSAFVEKLRLAGIDHTSPEGKAYIKELLKKSPQTVFMGGDKQKEEAYKSALATRKDMIEKVNADRELGARLDIAIDLLTSGAETGRIQSALMPLRQIGRELGFLSDKDVRNLSNQEIIESTAAFLTPRMRVVGSGASSDRDMDFFARATVRLANTPQANLVIAKMQKQLMNYNKKRLELFDEYVSKNGNDFGFGSFADEKMGSVYQRASTDEELTQLIKDGKLKKGDVYFNGFANEFMILLEEDM
tara:strand:- start:2198 stop:3451 length:1254 start_codon:yes stop_codon:yes gene_type:complete